MIRYLSGKVISVCQDYLCLDVSGFGLEIYASGRLMQSAQEGSSLTCLAYLQISEAGVTLFGFADERERALFLNLMQVKTMGGKLCITLLRHLSAEHIITSILSGNTHGLSVPGLGPKRAERICFEMKTKLEKDRQGLLKETQDQASPLQSIDIVVQEGLMGLGFSQQESREAIHICKKEELQKHWTEETLMKAALNRLQGSRHK